jgi:hypothetical protein
MAPSWTPVEALHLTPETTEAELKAEIQRLHAEAKRLPDCRRRDKFHQRADDLLSYWSMMYGHDDR